MTAIPNIITLTGPATIVSGSTPFGIYDSNALFQTDAPKVAKWVAARLGLPIMQVELTWQQVYSCFEEATAEYSTWINNQNMKDWLLSYIGKPLSASGEPQDFTEQLPVNSPQFQYDFNEWISSEVGSGGKKDWKNGWITTQANTQSYDLQELWGSVSESNARLDIKEVYHENVPPIERTAYGDYTTPFYMSNNATQELRGGTYFSSMYYMLPISFDVMRAQTVKLSDDVRKSAYSYEVINNTLRITPCPKSSFKIHFRYKIDSNNFTNDDSSISSGSYNSSVTNTSNVPLDFIEYSKINSTGKMWIRKYTLALAKELLGHIRSKYSTVPIPNNEVTLDGDALLSQAESEKEKLIEELKEFLLETGFERMTEKRKAISENNSDELAKVPLSVWMG